MIDSIFVAADRLVSDIASNNTGLLFKFVATRPSYVAICGGYDDAASDLSELYMDAVRRWVFRPKKHKRKKLSTFVYRSFTWGISRILRRKSLIRCEWPKVSPKILHFAGREGKSTTPRLLHKDDAERKIDIDCFVAAVDRVLLTLTPRESYVFMASLNGDTLDSIGADMQITRERVRQIGLKAKRKICNDVRAKCLLPFSHLAGEGRLRGGLLI